MFSCVKHNPRCCVSYGGFLSVLCLNTVNLHYIFKIRLLTLVLNMLYKLVSLICCISSYRWGGSLQIDSLYLLFSQFNMSSWSAFQLLVLRTRRAASFSLHYVCGASFKAPGARCGTQRTTGSRAEGWVRCVSIEEEDVCWVGASEARVTGQRPELHLHVFLHDDVIAAHQRPDGEEKTSVTSCVTTAWDIFTDPF